MRRQTKIHKFGVTLCAVFIIMLCVAVIIDKNSFIVTQWFSVSMLFLSIFLFYKAYIFKSDSSFYFAFVWLFSFIMMIITYINNFTFLQIWPFFIFNGSIPYLIDYVVFKNNFFIKTFFLTFSLFLIACLINFLLIL